MGGGRRHRFLHDVAAQAKVPTQSALEPSPQRRLYAARLLMNIDSASGLAARLIEPQTSRLIHYGSQKLALRHHAATADAGALWHMPTIPRGAWGVSVAD